MRRQRLRDAKGNGGISREWRSENWCSGRAPYVRSVGQVDPYVERGRVPRSQGDVGRVRPAPRAGLKETRTIDSKPFEKRWNPKVLDMVGGVPWRMSEDDPEMDGEAVRCVLQQSKCGRWCRNAFTPSGPTCNRSGTPIDVLVVVPDRVGEGRQQGHGEACRKRILGKLGKGDPRVIANEEKSQEILAKPIVENIKKKVGGEGSARTGAGAMTDVRCGGQTVSDAQRDSEQSGVGGGGGETIVDVVSGGQLVADALDSSGNGGGGVRVAIGPGGGSSSSGGAPQQSASASSGGQTIVGALGKRLSWAAESLDDQDNLREHIRLAIELAQAMGSATEGGEEWTKAWGDVGWRGYRCATRSRGPTGGSRAHEAHREGPGLREVHQEESYWREVGDMNKGSGEEPNVRCRLAAQDFKVGKTEDGFISSMPPLGAKSILFVNIVGRYGKWQAGEEETYSKVMFVDVNKSHLEATCDRVHTYMELPPYHAQEGYCAKLKKWFVLDAGCGGGVGGGTHGDSGQHRIHPRRLRAHGVPPPIPPSAVRCRRK